MFSKAQNNLSPYERLVRLNNRIIDKESEEDLYPAMQDCLSNYLKNNPQLLIRPIDGDSGDTWLHRAVKDKKIYLVNLLILNNANTEVRNLANQTPRNLAAKYQLSGIQWRVSSSTSEIPKAKQATEKTTSSANSRFSSANNASAAADEFRSFFPTNTNDSLWTNVGAKIKNEETKNAKPNELASLD